MVDAQMLRDIWALLTPLVSEHDPERPAQIDVNEYKADTLDDALGMTRPVHVLALRAPNTDLHVSFSTTGTSVIRVTDDEDVLRASSEIVGLLKAHELTDPSPPRLQPQYRRLASNALVSLAVGLLATIAVKATGHKPPDLMGAVVQLTVLYWLSLIPLKAPDRPRRASVFEDYESEDKQPFLRRWNIEIGIGLTVLSIIVSIVASLG